MPCLYRPPAATFEDIRFLDWRVELDPQAVSLLYNFHTLAPTAFKGIAFYDTAAPAAVCPDVWSAKCLKGSIVTRAHVPRQAGPGGWPWPRAVRIYRGGDFATPCLAYMLAGGANATSAGCWGRAANSRGPGGSHGTPSHSVEDPLDPLHIGKVP